MKYTSALLALAATVIATDDWDHDKGKDKTITKTTEIVTTITTLCPVTKTHHGPGTTYYETVTELSTVVTKVPTVIYETIPGPTEHVTETDVEYTTYTSWCPIVRLPSPNEDIVLGLTSNTDQDRDW